MKIIPIWAIFITSIICNIRAENNTILKNIKNILHENWEMYSYIEGIVQPTHWPNGKGSHILLRRKNYNPIDWKYGLGGEISIWIMDEKYDHSPFDYAFTPESQVPGAREIGIWNNHKVLLWGDPGKDWPTWKENLIEIFGEAFIKKDTAVPHTAKRGRISEKESIPFLKQKLKSGTPEEKEEVLDIFMAKYIIELVPDIIEATLDDTVSPRHGDTGWGNIYHQAATALCQFAYKIDGITQEERGLQKYTFFDDVGTASKKRRKSVYGNWLKWWKKNKAKIFNSGK